MIESLQEDLFVHDEWFPSEMKLLSPPEDITTAEWAERHRFVSKSSKPGPWNNENNSPLVGIMNASDRRGQFRNTRLMAICKGVQTGVTVAAHNIIYRRMDGSGSNALLVMETEKKVRRTSNQRIQPDIRKSDRLAAQMSSNPDDTSNSSIIMSTGFCLNIGWAGSLAALASDPCETVVLDEVDKYEHAMNIEEAKDRITIYRRTGLVIVLSTPGFEDGPIMTELANCDTVMDYQARCPDCGELQAMKFEHFWWPDKGADLKGMEAHRRLANRVIRERSARYICSGCGVLWDDYARDRAVRDGLVHNYYGWRMREEIDLPGSIGFHFPSWISPFKSLSDVAGRYLKAQDPAQPGRLRAWRNNEAAEPFVESEENESLSGDLLLSRREDYGPVLPEGVAIITMAADIQPDRIECEAVGWGMDEESWGLEHRVFIGDVKRPEVWKDFDEYRKKTFRHASGKDLRSACVAIDTGDGNTMKTACDFIRPRQGERVYGVKGSSRPGLPIIAGRPSFKNKGRIALFFVGTDTAKSAIHGNLRIESFGPGYMHYNRGYDEEYFKQLCAEKVVTTYRHGFAKRAWVKTRARNEAFDIRVYSLAALEILKTYRGFNLNRLAAVLDLRAKEKTSLPVEAVQETPQVPEPPQKSSRATGRPRGGWMKGWRR